ncbi:MAG: hypothetical protein WD035_02900 [Balneolaceae bacterium]
MKYKYFNIKVLILSTVALFFTTTEIKAQVDLGVDIMSRYVWRGADFGNSPSIQPDISITAGNFAIGTWAAFATTGNPDGTEVDWYASYTIDAGNAGAFDLVLTDYSFPVGPGYFSESDVHFVETGIGYGGPDSFPVSIFAGMFVTNDDDNSVYIELGYDTGPLDLVMGFTPSESATYGTTGAGVINLGFGTSREVQVSELLSIDLSASVTTNPYNETLFFVFGFGL